MISWCSKKQELFALSTSKVEYSVVTAATCQAVWLRRLLLYLKQKQSDATEILCDNRSAIAMTKNPTFRSRTKHINIHYHFIWSYVSIGEIVLKACDTTEQVTDIFLRSSFCNHSMNSSKCSLGVCNFEARGSVEK